jgi:hypothetical protein
VAATRRVQFQHRIPRTSALGDRNLLEHSIAGGVVSGFPSSPMWNSMEPAREEGTMWIALFSIAAAAAIVLSVAAVMVQTSQGDTLRG